MGISKKEISGLQIPARHFFMVRRTHPMVALMVNVGCVLRTIVILLPPGEDIGVQVQALPGDQQPVGCVSRTD
jgi:hypothetical protein